MEGELFDLVENNPRLTIEFSYHGVSDYVIWIREEVGGDYKDVVHEQSCDRTLVCANAYLKLTKYLCETRGGY